MGFGQRCKCTECDFDFCSGHSHHEGASSAVCKECLTLFDLPTKNFWGPEIAEVIELFKVEKRLVYKHKKKPPRTEWSRHPTGEFLLAEPSGQEWGRVHYPIDTVICPQCKTKGSLILDFESGENCPQCKSGKLECSQVIY